MASSKEGNKQSGGKGGQGSGTSSRGFASMDPDRQREIASEGGKAAHQKGTAHEFTSEEARKAGSMSHGNRQSEQASTGSGAKQGASGGNKQSSQDAGDKGASKGSEKGSEKGSAGGGGKSR